MANTVDVTTLLSGPRNAIFNVYLRSDGASGELVSYPLIKPADLGMPAGSRFSIMYLMNNFAGFDAVIEFGSGGVSPNWKWVLTEGTNTPADFKPFGSLHDNSGMDGTGYLQISTTGFTSSTDQGSILIHLKKEMS